MIKIILAFIFSHSLYASTSLVIQHSSKSGGEQKAAIFEQDQVLVVRNSTYYDKNIDYRLGQLSGNKTDNFNKLEDRLKLISQSILNAEKILEKHGSSFKKINNNANPHGDKIFLDKILVNEDSIFFKELEKIITSLDTTKFNLIQGVRLSNDKKMLETFKGGIAIGHEDFIIPFFCDQPKLPAKCSIRDQGIIYLK